MRQIVITTIILSFIWSCNLQTKEEDSTVNKDSLEKESNDLSIESNSTERDLNYDEVNRNYIDSLMLDICLTKDIEFIDLYPVLDSIAPEKHEKLVIVDSLKMKGFDITNWGKGNWVGGPRIVSFTMSNQQCECQIDKLYYSTEQEGKYRVTERLKCKKNRK